MTAYVKVHREYLGIVISQLKKVNGVKILQGIDPDKILQELCVSSRLSEDLRYRLDQIDQNGYLMFSYRIC